MQVKMWYAINMNSNFRIRNGISELARASRHRFADARALLRASRWQGAMYIAGYAVECLLKTKLMRIYGCRTLGDLEDELQRRSILPEHGTVFTHRLRDLLKLAPGHNRLVQNREMWSLFNKVNHWTPRWRYTFEPANRQVATDFVAGIERLMHWIDNNI